MDADPILPGVNQAITESFVASQERNRKLAESFFTDGIEVLKSNQAAAKDLLAAQESNRKIAERFFKDGMELLKTSQAAAESLIAAQEGNVELPSGSLRMVCSFLRGRRRICEH